MAKNWINSVHAYAVDPLDALSVTFNVTPGLELDDPTVVTMAFTPEVAVSLARELLEQARKLRPDLPDVNDA